MVLLDSTHSKDSNGTICNFSSYDLEDMIYLSFSTNLS
jgi:hypothetical protein